MSAPLSRPGATQWRGGAQPVTLGVLVERDHVRGAVVRNGVAVASAAWSRPEGDTADVEDGVADVLRQLRDDAGIGAGRGRLLCRGRVRVVIAAAPAFVQVKRIAGLPSSRDAVLLRQIIAADPDRFFLGGAGRIIGSHVRVIGPGEVWCAAFDAALVARLSERGGALKLPLSAVVPAVGVIGLAIDRREIEWRDDGAVHAARYDSQGRLAAQHVRWEGEGLEAAALPDGSSGELLRGAAVHGAATCLARWPDALPMHLLHEALVLQRRRRTRLRVAAAACLVAALWAALAPEAALWRAAARAERYLDGRRAEVAAATAAERTGESQVVMLRAIDRVDRTRERSVVRVLGELAQALPTTVRVTALHLDSAGGTLSALAPTANALMNGLSRVSAIHAVELTGPIVNEPTPRVPSSAPVVAGALVPAVLRTGEDGEGAAPALARITVRFRWRPVGAMPARPSQAARDSVERGA